MVFSISGLLYSRNPWFRVPWIFPLFFPDASPLTHHNALYDDVTDHLYITALVCWFSFPFASFSVLALSHNAAWSGKEQLKITQLIAYIYHYRRQSQEYVTEYMQMFSLRRHSASWLAEFVLYVHYLWQESINFLSPPGYSQCKTKNKPRGPGENRHRHRDNMQTPHRKVQGWNPTFFQNLANVSTV